MRRPLRVAIEHSFYRAAQPSGENNVVSEQARALRDSGATAEVFAQHTDKRASRPTYPLEAAVTVALGRGPNPVTDLKRFAPDVVHVHNLFPNFGRTWVQHWPGPLVTTLHNFRSLCPAATFYRDGHICTDCLDSGSSIPALIHKCYGESRLRTLPLAVGTRFAKDPVLARSDRLIVLNQVMRSLYTASGVPDDRIREVPNFLDSDTTIGPGRGPWVYVGRLSDEKGIVAMLKSWPRSEPLVVIGDGPRAPEVERLSGGNITFLGRRTREEVSSWLRSAVGLVFPSRWYEGLPGVYLEALSAGTPVLAWEPSSVAGLVRLQATGAIASDASLEHSIVRAKSTFPGLRKHVRKVFEDNYVKDVWLKRITDLYLEVVNQRSTVK